jgi:hypothetical protein
MKLSWRIYCVLAAVFAGSAAVMSLLQASEIWRDVASLPALLSLVGALYQLVRDEARHLKHLSLQHDQQRFALGATSHMANVAFDKHVAFCEEYVHELNETVKTLYAEGPSPKALEHARRLSAVRLKHVVWLTPDIESALDKFDIALTKIGALAHAERQHGERPISRKLVDEMYGVFADVLGLENATDKQLDPEVEIKAIIQRARDYLGVSELIGLRKRLLELRRFPGEHAAGV